MNKIVKILIVGIMLAGLTVPVFSQEDMQLPGVNNEGDNPGMAVNIDFGYTFGALLAGGFGLGGGFEFSVTDLIAVKIRGGFLSINYLGYGFTAIDVAGTARFYFLNTGLNGPFAGAGAGVYVFMSDSVYYGTGGTMLWPLIMIEGGYKFTLMNNGSSGFFVEPILGFSYVFSTLGTLGVSGVGGFSFGANIGWSF